MEPIIKFIPPFRVEVHQEGLPPRRINLNKLAVQAIIEEDLQEFLKQEDPLMDGKKKLNKNQLKAQAHFIRGASAALQAVFGTDEALTDFVSPHWVTSIWRGDRIVSIDEIAKKGA